MDLLTRFLVPAFTFLLGWWLQSYRTQTAEDIQQLSELAREIEVARDFATDYWSRDRQDDDRSLEVKMRSSLHLTFAMVPDANVADGDALALQVDRYYELITSGTFETAEKSSDLGRALEIRIAAAELIALLRKRRRHMNSWAFVPATVWRAIRRFPAVARDPYKLGQATRRWRQKHFGGDVNNRG